MYRYTNVRANNDHQQEMCVWDESNHDRRTRPNVWSPGELERRLGVEGKCETEK